MQEVAAGLALTPKEQVVTIKNSPILGITFSQFRATVTGTVKCIGKFLLTCRRAVVRYQYWEKDFVQSLKRSGHTRFHVTCMFLVGIPFKRMQVC